MAVLRPVSLALVLTQCKSKKSQCESELTPAPYNLSL